MSTRSFGILLILLLAMLSTACSSASATQPSQADIDREEQAVYSVFGAESTGPMLILQRTSTNIAGENPKETRAHIHNSFETVSNETVESYLARNTQPSELSRDMDLDDDYILLNEEELAKITRPQNWRAILQERYPGSNGYLIFSRVGFNRSLDQAVIYVGHVEGPLMGAGYYYLLEKQDGKWAIQDEVMIWIS
jgi:hypothetical protein